MTEGMKSPPSFGRLVLGCMGSYDSEKDAFAALIYIILHRADLNILVTAFKVETFAEKDGQSNSNQNWKFLNLLI